MSSLKRLSLLHACAFGCVLLAACLVPGQVNAQVALKAVVEHRVVLQFEPLYMFIRVRNEMGIPLVLGTGSGMARLSVSASKDGEFATYSALGAPAVSDLVAVPVDGEKLILADLTRWCDVRREGTHRLQARLEWRGRTYTAKDVMVDVVPGIEVARQVRPVPWEGGVDRAYSLRYWSRSGEVYLFLRVDEPELGLNYGVFLLGEMLRSHRPTLKIDREGHVTVTHQSSVDAYTVSSFLSEPTRVIFVEQTSREAEKSRY